MIYDCPQCGEETETLHEGYCEECRIENSAAVHDHRHQFTEWESLSVEQRNGKINAAINHRN